MSDAPFPVRITIDGPWDDMMKLIRHPLDSSTIHRVTINSETVYGRVERSTIDRGERISVTLLRVLFE